MNWSPIRSRVAKTLTKAPTWTDGYREVSAKYGCTPTAVRLAHERGTFGRLDSKAPPMRAARDEVAALRVAEQLSSTKAAFDRLVKELAERDDQIRYLTELRAAKPLKPIVAPKRVSAKQRYGVPVMLCSDWHVEEPVRPETVNGMNEYDLGVAEACIQEIPEAYEWFLRDSRFDCRDGILWLGGDLYSGYIHEELEEANFLSPTQAVLWLQERVERMIRRILATTNLERLRVVCNDGNHGRTTHKIRVSTRTANSLEWLLYKTLAARLADEPRVEFQIAESEWNYVEIFSQTHGFTHGDSFKYGGGVGGISIPLRRGINEVRKYRSVQHVSLGHFHQRCDFGDIMVNGSMIGFSPYAMRIHAPPEQRQQSFYLVDSEHGKCFTAPVWLPSAEKVRNKIAA